MRVATNAFTENFLNQVGTLRAQQDRLQQQTGSGLKLSLPEDNPGAMASVLNLQAQASANTQYQTNISNLQSQATTTYDALNSLKTITNRLGEIATLADGTKGPSELATYATEVDQLLQQALALGNTKDSSGNYIFGGTDSGTAPYVATTDASGNITGVTYQGNTSVASAEIGPGVTVSSQIPGGNTTGSGTRGLFTDTRYGADLFNHIITLGQNLKSGNTAAISSTDAPAISKDEDNLLYQVTANGLLQTRLEAAGNLATQTGQTITSQVSNLTDADMAQTLTQFSQAQTAYQAALQSGVSIMNLSILNFLK